jgi:uncharacterized protein YjbI with pentapeptide repeats
MKLNKPKLTKAGLNPISVRQLTAEASLEQISLAGADAGGLRAKNLGIDEATLEKVLLTEAKLERLSLSDAELKACDLSAASCSESSLIRVHVIGGRMTGIDLSRSTIKDVIFEGCKLDLANFRFTKLTRVQFIDCMMTETDFQAAELNEVEFQNSHLEKVEFGQCRIKGVDARTSQLFDIRGWQSLKGLKIDSTQLVAIAPQLAAELGLIIDDGI